MVERWLFFKASPKLLTEKLETSVSLSSMWSDAPVVHRDDSNFAGKSRALILPPPKPSDPAEMDTNRHIQAETELPVINQICFSVFFAKNRYTRN